MKDVSYLLNKILGQFSSKLFSVGAFLNKRIFSSIFSFTFLFEVSKGQLETFIPPPFALSLSWMHTQCLTHIPSFLPISNSLLHGHLNLSLFLSLSSVWWFHTKYDDGYLPTLLKPQIFKRQTRFSCHNNNNIFLFCFQKFKKFAPILFLIWSSFYPVSVKLEQLLQPIMVTT